MFFALSCSLGCATSNAGDAGPGDSNQLDQTPDFGPAPAHDASVGDLAGDHWDGTFDGDPFPSGSHRIQIIFDHASGDGPRTGVVILGMAAPPPSPRDPTVGYPRGFDFESVFTITLTEGFVYPIVEGSIVGTHMHVVINGIGLWEPWCELQTPVFSAPPGDGWGCLPYGTGSGLAPDCIYETATGPWFPIDCGRAALCMTPGLCQCTADGCSARLRDPIRFELEIRGTTATGAWRGNLQLTRM
jgi:hypothetical protein